MVVILIRDLIFLSSQSIFKTKSISIDYLESPRYTKSIKFKPQFNWKRVDTVDIAILNLFKQVPPGKKHLFDNTPIPSSYVNVGQRQQLVASQRTIVTCNGKRTEDSVLWMIHVVLFWATKTKCFWRPRRCTLNDVVVGTESDVVAVFWTTL